MNMTITYGISENEAIRRDFKEFLILNDIQDVVEKTDISYKILSKFKRGKDLNAVYLERLKAYLTIY